MNYTVYFWRGEPDAGIKFCLGFEIIWTEEQCCKAEAFKMLKTDGCAFTEEDLNTFKMEEFPNMSDPFLDCATEYYRNGSTDIFLKKDMQRNIKWQICKIDLDNPEHPHIFMDYKEFFDKIANSTKCGELKKRLDEIKKTVDCIKKS